MPEQAQVKTREHSSSRSLLVRVNESSPTGRRGWRGLVLSAGQHHGKKAEGGAHREAVGLLRMY